MTWLWVILNGLGVIRVIMAVLSVLQCRKLLGRFKREPAVLATGDLPRAWVIVPFKGLDADLTGCVRSLCTQNHHDYRLLLVVDSPSDPAYAVLQNQIARFPQRSIQLLVAGATQGSQSQKVHNQLYALEQVMGEARDEDVLVFADSDAVPGENWLAEMVFPTADDQTIGMTTGYRWLIPSADPQTGRVTVWSHLASLINSSVACIYRNRLTSRAWGGAMAVRVSIARAGNLLSRLQGALTDDYQFTQMCRDLKKRVWFVPRCLVATPVHFSMGEFFNFARRQYLITRVYEPGTFTLALLILTGWVVGMAATWTALIWALLQPGPHRPWWFALTMLALVMLANQLRAWYRRQVIRTAFGESTLRQLRVTLWLDQWATWCWMLLHWGLVLGASVGKKMRWRGITYVLHGPQQVQRLE